MARRFDHLHASSRFPIGKTAVSVVVAWTLAAPVLTTAAPPNWDRYSSRSAAERLVPGAVPNQPGAPNFAPQAPNSLRQYNDAQENARRDVGRMTPEQRQHLRRQINEAGRDIYRRQR